MKGFIKITDVRQKEQYLNVKHIIKFTATSKGHEGNTSIVFDKVTDFATITTSSTPDEIADMIDLATN